MRHHHDDRQPGFGGPRPGDRGPWEGRGRGPGHGERRDRPEHDRDDHDRHERPERDRPDRPDRGERRGLSRGQRRGPGRGRGRAQRGDVRTAVLLLLAEQPMHGYQLMQAMSDRTNGAWRPSPGAIYPTIAQLEDEGLVRTQAEGGRRLVTLTEEGRAHLEEHREGLNDPFGDTDGPSGPDLRQPLHELHAAARQVAVSGDPTQVEAAARVLAQARRALYLILAGEAETSDHES